MKSIYGRHMDGAVVADMCTESCWWRDIMVARRLSQCLLRALRWSRTQSLPDLSWAVMIPSIPLYWSFSSVPSIWARESLDSASCARGTVGEALCTVTCHSTSFTLRSSRLTSVCRSVNWSKADSLALL
ncbi:hypothetical protein H310_10342 [Aphanomyces invadans]|uniref:Uncharacterized protein n=1 Tax=Aphanomyces invadans TaxID=157072 RepID=A0A024TSQ9_9STRA|nr:hypothetical protein H310_10342 [Aphanomyces invadans]ETV96666.1 hypothetical protein H310_10342 [Aphanomyces invadans]|eukprot:XP_008874929.1 hypothetical protein H310_10342 [Aphanomyces invadans]